jgi:hypothetical protein
MSRKDRTYTITGNNIPVDYVGVSEIARAFGISDDTARQAIARGRVPGAEEVRTFGGRKFFCMKRSALAALVEARKPVPVPVPGYGRGLFLDSPQSAKGPHV